MNFISKYLKWLFDHTRFHFTKGGKLEKVEPLFDAAESFFFIPGIEIRHAPHVRDHLDLKRFMFFVVIALIPPSFFGIYNAGYQSHLASGLPLNFLAVSQRGLIIFLPIVLVSYSIGFFWEIVFSSIRKKPISEGLLVTGLLFPLTLPPTIPLWQVAIGISFGVVIGKEIFGGTGRNIFNPALTARAFLFFAYPSKMSGDAVWIAVKRTSVNAVDAVTGATPLSFTSIVPPFESIEKTLAGNGYTWTKLFFGMYPGSIGETSMLCCLIGAIILIVVGIASYRIMLGGIFGLLATGFFLNLLATPNSIPWLSINPFYHLVVGGFAFGIVYMATDPVSAPGTKNSKWVYGFFIGVLTILIRVFNPAFPEGVMLAILFMNLFSPLLDYIEINISFKKRISNV
ncbi:MAG: NADH:ubiquinone reductase (Na(+)-transporting) subunit B [Desulfobacterales bacterium]|nr:NADH:ubiquinone reductase (Na(+)-transporting) subunit B [Desulfobacterales bacterium]